MRKAIDEIIKIEKLQAQQNMIYELLGKYGDNLPDEINEDMRVYAEDLGRVIKNTKGKIIV